MTLREFLHIEIWSKKTSRKVFIGLRKISVVLGFIAFVFAGFYLFAFLWTSSGERRAGREALTKIDGLQPLLDRSDDSYRAADEQAKEQVEIAYQSSLTKRDRNIALVLLSYLVVTEAEKSDRMFRLKASASSDERLQKLASQTLESSRSRQQFLGQLKQRLHRELD